jgi:hypothetical protein
LHAVSPLAVQEKFNFSEEVELLVLALRRSSTSRKKLNFWFWPSGKIQLLGRS